MEEAITTLLGTLEVPEVITRAGRLLGKHFGGTRVTLARWDEARPEEVEVLWVEDPRHPGPSPGARLPLAGTAIGEAIRTRAPVTLDHLGVGEARFREEEELGRLGYGAMACFPLLAEERVLGVLGIAHVPPEEILCQCFQPAERIARLIAIALHHSEMVAEIRRLNQLLHRENTVLRDEVRAAHSRWHFEPRSAAMAAALEQVALVAPSDTTVLVRGETGTGKEGIARLLHERSHRSSGPFVPVNLGAIPESLIESELFGHEKGAFTGASRRQVGRFEQASGGTIFLDEVGDAPPSLQVKLLRALQEREVHRVGGSEAVAVDVRVVAATNRPLEQLVETGLFRQDLYYRLNIFPIPLPPLRERTEDLQPLARHLLARLASQLHRPVPTVPDKAWRDLAAYPWPGNVRELENTLERALLLSPGDTLVLPLPLGGIAPGSGTPIAARVESEAASIRPFDQSVRELLQRALAVTDGRIYGPDGAAARLGLKPTTLQGKLRKHGIR